MHKLTIILRKNKNQRIINGIIGLVLLLWVIVKWKYVIHASDINVHYTYDVLKFITIIYFIQTVINKNWLHWITKGIYVLLLVFVMYSYFYSFFDKNDVVIHKEYGVLIKTWGTFLKASILLFILWFTNNLKPIRYTSSLHG